MSTAVGRPTTVKNKIKSFMQNLWFQGAMAGLIVANALVIGLETDMADLPYWDYLEAGFLLVFTLEFLVKIIIHGVWDFFRATSEESCWNALDFFIIFLGWLECITEIAGLGAKSSAKGFATLFRIFRLLRILRIFKVLRFLKQLYMLAFGLALAATAIVWVTVLMAFVLYICSIVLVRTVGRMNDDDPRYEILVTSFNTIPTSMFTLFNLMACPNLLPYFDILPEFPLLGMFLVVFVIFGSFGMVAILTGVISEAMFEKNQLRAEEDRRERDDRRLKLSDIFQDFFTDLPIDENGKATKEVIQEVIPKIKDLFETEGIVYASHEFDGMIEIMDNGDGLLDKDEFCDGVLQIAEGLRSFSIIEIHYEVAECVAQMTDLKRILGSCLTHLEALTQESTNSESRTKADASSELQSLVLEIHGEMKLIGSAVQGLAADTRSVVFDQSTGQLMGLKENVEKCLGYLEEGTIASTSSVHGDPVCSSKGAMAAVDGLLWDLRHEVQSLCQRPLCSHSTHMTKLEGPCLSTDGGTCMDMLETIVHEALEAHLTTRVEMEEAKREAKLRAETQSLAARLARGIACLPMTGVQVERCSAVGPSDGGRAGAAGQGIAECAKVWTGREAQSKSAVNK